MIYLMLGDDRPAKEKNIAELKQKHLAVADARNLDFESLDGAKTDPATLKKSLLSLPAIAPKRFVLIRRVDKLKTPNKNILLSFLDEDHDHCVLVLDSDTLTSKSSFFAKLQSKAKVARFGSGESKKNVFDVTKAMDRRDPAGALKILDQLMSGGDHPLQIMGGLVWYWGNAKRRLSSDKFKKGLLVLQEADLNIKRSRLKPEYAVELAVTQLSSLIAC